MFKNLWLSLRGVLRGIEGRLSNLNLRLLRSHRSLAMTNAGILTRRPVLIVLEILAVFLLTILVDRALGIYFDRTLYFKAYKPNQTQYYETSEFKFKASISSQGLRNGEVARKKEEGTSRILVLGDSFVWGWGVDDEKSWPKILERMLGDSGKKVEVINAGIYGGDLFMETEVCDDYVSKFKPDAIILGFYATDDLNQNYSEYVKNKDFFERKVTFMDNFTAFLWPNLVKLKKPRYVVEPGNIDDSGNYFALNKWRNIVESAKGTELLTFRKVSPRIKKDFFDLKINPVLVLAAQRDPIYWTYLLKKEDFDASLTATDKLLGFLARCTKNIGVDVVLIPSEELVDKKYQQYRREIGFEMDDRLLNFDFDNYLEPVVKKHGFSYISLLSDFRADGCLDCYYPHDSHMTEVGYRRVAEKIFEELK